MNIISKQKISNMNFKALSDRELSDLLHKKETWLERLNYNMQGNYDCADDDPDERYVEELRREIKQIKDHFDKKKQEEFEKLSDEKLQELLDRKKNWVDCALKKMRETEGQLNYSDRYTWSEIHLQRKRIQQIELIKYGPGAGGVG
jgi:predicted metal-dependent hydrolase